MATLVVKGEVDQYGATQEGPLLVPLAMTAHNTNTKTTSTPPLPAKNMKKFVFGIMGLVAAVASGASLLSSTLDSSVPATAEDSFLLTPNPNRKCVAASGP